MQIARVCERLPRLQIQFRISRSFRPQKPENLRSKIRFWIRRKELTRNVTHPRTALRYNRDSVTVILTAPSNQTYVMSRAVTEQIVRVAGWCTSVCQNA